MGKTLETHGKVANLGTLAGFPSTPRSATTRKGRSFCKLFIPRFCQLFIPLWSEAAREMLFFATSHLTLTVDVLCSSYPPVPAWVWVKSFVDDNDKAQVASSSAAFHTATLSESLGLRALTT